jgi:hypothetical protein
MEEDQINWYLARMKNEKWSLQERHKWGQHSVLVNGRNVIQCTQKQQPVKMYTRFVLMRIRQNGVTMRNFALHSGCEIRSLAEVGLPCQEDELIRNILCDGDNRNWMILDRTKYFTTHSSSHTSEISRNSVTFFTNTNYKFLPYIKPVVCDLGFWWLYIFSNPEIKST